MYPQPRSSMLRRACARVAAFLTLTVLATSSFAAIAFDSAATKVATNAASASWTHTVGTGTNTVLIVGLATEDTSTTSLAVSAITYNGVAMTAVASSTATAGSSTLDRTQLFYLLNPAAGAHTVAITFGGAVNGVSAGSVSLSGVAQSAPTAAAINTATSGTASSASVAVATAGSWIVDVANSGASNATLTAGSSQTKRWGVSQSNSGGAGSTAAPASTGTISVSWTASSSSQLALSVAVFAPSGGTTVTAPAITTQPVSQTVTTGSSVTFSVVASGTAPLSYQWKLGVTNISGATSASYTIASAQSANAGSYTVTVTNSAGSATSNAATLTVSATATAPSISTQPTSRTVTAGSTTTFSVVASGTAPLTYQWKLGGTNISGATSASYTIANVQSANAGSYTVTVTNSVGSVTSNAATLTVSATATAPSITTQPVSQTVTAGSSVTFNVVASGTATLTYQWKLGGTNISGATSSSYMIASAQTAHAGSYTVTVANSAGSVTSSTATLTVNAATGGDIIYVSPTGTDSNPGTITAPTTLAMAIAESIPGDTIYMRGGTYNYSATIVIAFGNNGTASATKKIFAFQAEVPVLNFSAQATADANRGMHLFGNYWHLKGLTIQNAGDNGVLIGGNNHTIERCTFKGNRDSGLQIARRASSLTSMADWPSNNLVLNCDAFDNADPGAENADGFACKLTSGPGNVFRGCISHHNIDDGWDLYAKTDTGAIGPVLIENCIAYSNGTLTTGGTSGSGDKNGFKLGGSGVAVQHTIRRSLAFNNGHHGFTDNNNPGPITVTNNTSFNNTNSGFNFRSGGNSVFTNNASLNAGSSDATFSTLTGTTNLFWVSGASNNNGGAKVISAADFQNLTPPSSFARNADGSINLGTFAKLVSGSDLVNGGTPSGTDIGAVESF